MSFPTPPPISVTVSAFLSRALDCIVESGRHLCRNRLGLTMVLGKILKWTAYGSGIGITSFFWTTRQSKVFQLPRTDYLYNTTWYARYNAENNPTLSDVCVRRVPLDQIQPDLLEKPGKLVERYCAGVWGGIGM